mmetsp:Transcript_6322/g.14572  ORF Transcript_6322/g.14572 Transcript_6322/m.14572 type:complete len:212 (-) Transcript_6322:426-1061(-)
MRRSRRLPLFRLEWRGHCRSQGGRAKRRWHRAGQLLLLSPLFGNCHLGALDPGLDFLRGGQGRRPGPGRVPPYGQAPRPAQRELWGRAHRADRYRRRGYRGHHPAPPGPGRALRHHRGGHHGAWPWSAYLHGRAGLHLLQILVGSKHNQDSPGSLPLAFFLQRGHRHVLPVGSTGRQELRSLQAHRVLGTPVDSCGRRYVQQFRRLLRLHS